MSDCIIVVDHAEKRFGDQVALRDVSVSFEAGKIHVMLNTISRIHRNNSYIEIRRLSRKLPAFPIGLFPGAS